MRLVARLAPQLLLCAALLASCSSSVAPEEPLAPRIRALEHRAELIRDANDIKRLQRAYGFYWDKGMWDDVADLFTADATIQYGSEASLAGQEQVRRYFHDLHQGRIGLAFGEMNNHMILQPVVHVASDGLTAKARWRVLIQSGQFKQSASWGEGIYEVQYRKEAGVWKISQLRGYPTFLAPYRGGWAHSKEPPSTAIAPFHYSTPAQERSVPPVSPGGGEIATWELELRKIEAHDAIENLQAIYGYYIDQNLWDDAARLFSEDATYEIEQRGVYNGRKRIRAALGLKGASGPQAGRLSIEMQLQPLIHVSDDGLRAKARWRTLEMKGVHDEAGQWGEGVYENEYRLDNGVWRISKLHYYLTFRADYDKGWTEGPLPIETASKTLPPDAPPTEVYAALPDVYLPPYHYANPVTHASPRLPASSASPSLRNLASKIERLNDEIDVQNLQRSYGYYVDKHMWDEVVELFADDATLEIGGRGVFAGKPRIREYLYFLGQKGPARGWLYDHSQWQLIVHVAEDGTTAQARLRAFIMGGAPKRENAGSSDAVFGEATAFGEATYENRYVKQGGVWKIRRLYAYFNMYTPYSKGWGEVGMPNTNPEAALPPDRPPTVKYETYPTPGLVPYHYPNPVSGRAWNR